MNTIKKIVKDTVPPKSEVSRVAFDSLWLDVSDKDNPSLKTLSDGEYKDVTGAASVSMTTTDPQTGEPTTVTGLSNVLNTLIGVVEQGGGGGAKVVSITPEEFTVNEIVTISGELYGNLLNASGIYFGSYFLPRNDAGIMNDFVMEAVKNADWSGPYNAIFLQIGTGDNVDASFIKSDMIVVFVVGIKGDNYCALFTEI